MFVGMEVEGHFSGSWDPGTISEIHQDGTFDIVYEDGYEELGMAWGNDLRPLQT